MIPWFVVSMIGLLLRPFGRDVYVTAISGRRGAERIHLVPLDRSLSRPRRLAPYRGGTIEPGEMMAPMPGVAPATWIGPLPAPGGLS